MLKRYAYTAYPTPSQKQLFVRTFGSARFVYNKYVERNKANGKPVAYKEASANLTALKTEYDWLGEVSSVALQQSIRDATRAVSNHYLNPKHFKLPKYKKRASRQSFRVVGTKDFVVTKLNAKWGGVRLPKAGILKFRVERELPSIPQSVTLIKESSGAYTVSFVVDVISQPKPLVAGNKVAALDLGITTYATIADSEGKLEEISNPRYYRNSERKVKKLQRSLSRKQKDSKNWEKARIALAKQHAHVAAQRKDFMQKLVHKLCDENQVIGVETLAVKNMIRNRSTSKSIMDAGWGLFLVKLKEKTSEYGRLLILADRYYPSSKTCSNCGVINNELGREKYWHCVHCDTHHDRDVNAALNLLYLAVGSSSQEGQKESLNACGRAAVALVRSKYKETRTTQCVLNHTV